VSGPAFDLPEPAAARAGWGGWVSLAIVLVAMTSFSLWQYFERDGKGEPSFVDASNRFRMMVLQKEAIRRFPVLARAESQVDDAIGDLVSEVVGSRKASAGAARLYAAMRHELGKEVKPEDVAVLANSKKPEEQAFAQVYASKELTPEQAKALAAKFPEQGFSYRMAEVHAREKAGEKDVRQAVFSDADVVRPSVAILMALAAFGLGTLLLFVYFGVRLAGAWKPKGHPAGKLTPAEADGFAGKAAWMLFAFLAIAFVLEMTAGQVLRSEAVSLLGGAATIGFALWMLRSKPGGPGRKLLEFRREEPWQDALWGFCGFFVGVPLFLCCALVSQRLLTGLPAPDHPLTFEIQANQSLPMLVFFLAMASVIAPIFEEICFRGTIAPACETLFGGPFMGVFASSLAFAMIHPQGITGWMPLAMIGATAAMLCYQRRSLLSSIVYHASHNTFILTMNVLMS
jgi:membrane protease YdiL (CAAX protease family)